MTTFTTLPQVAHFIDRHHSVFGCPFNTKSTLSVLGDLNHMIRTSAVCGATYNAWLKLDDGSELPTQIEINKHPDGYWMVTETVRH
jgi:hypothetical protein